MITFNYSSFNNNMNNYVDKVSDKDETLLVKRNGDRNIVILSEKHITYFGKYIFKI